MSQDHAGEQDRNDQDRVRQDCQAGAGIKAVRAKPSVLNANARMGRHHHRHHHFHKHNFHKHMGAYKAHQFSKVTLKHAHPTVKRG